MSSDQWETIEDGDEGFGDDEVFDDDAVGRPFLPRRPFEEPDEATRTADKPLTNTEPLPLFPGSNKSQARKAKEIKVTKLDPPNHGYKGKVPIGVDEEFVANQWGDGTYTFEAVNGRGVTIQKVEAVRISTGRELTPEVPVMAGGALDANEAFRQTNLSHAQERARTGRLHSELLNRTTDLAREHTKMVMESTTQSIERDRQFYEAGQSRTEKFFETILASTIATHEREMARMRAEHELSSARSREEFGQQLQLNEQRHAQLLEILTAGHSRELQLMEAAGTDEDPASKMLSSGVEALRELRLGYEAHARGRLPAGARRALGTGARTPNPGPRSISGPRENGKSTREVSEFAREIAALKRECDNRGIDFRELVRDARTQVQNYERDTGSGDGAENGVDAKDS